MVVILNLATTKDAKKLADFMSSALKQSEGVNLDPKEAQASLEDSIKSGDQVYFIQEGEQIKALIPIGIEDNQATLFNFLLSSDFESKAKEIIEALIKELKQINLSQVSILLDKSDKKLNLFKQSGFSESSVELFYNLGGKIIEDDSGPENEE